MSVPTAYNQVSANNLKTFLLMVGFSFFVAAVAYIFMLALNIQGVGALGFVGIFLIVSGFINLGSYYWSDKLVIALAGAKAVEKKDFPELYRIVENLSIASGLPMPKVYVVNDNSPNAFATGRDPDHAAIAVTTGLLAQLEDLELEGVIAHELSHIKNKDTRLMTIVVVLVGFVALLADIFFRSLYWGDNRSNRREGGIILFLGVVAALLAPIAANIIKLAISRRREFLADASGVLITRYPEGLAKALIKISQNDQPVKNARTVTAHLYIEDPFKNRKKQNWIVNLFNTHPPIEERVKALRAMAGL